MPFHDAVNNVPADPTTAPITVTAARAVSGPTLSVSDGSQFGATFPLYITVLRSGSPRCILEVTGRSGNNLAISGAAPTSTDVAQSAGDTVEMRITADHFNELQAALNTRDKVAAYDDFSGKPDGPLGTLITGQPWISNVIGAPTQTSTIVGGTMGPPLPQGPAAYPTVDLGVGVKPSVVWADVVFGAAGTTGSAAGILISPVNPMNLASISSVIHYVIGDGSWTFGIYNGGVLSPISSGNYTAPLVTDGLTRHTAGITIAGNTATLHLPDRTRKTVTDPRIGQFNGQYVTFESFVPAGSHDVRFARVAAQTRSTALVAPQPSYDDVWNAVADVVAGLPTLGANTYNDAQTMVGGSVGLVIKQLDNATGIRWLTNNDGHLYWQSTTSNFAAITPTLTIEFTGGTTTFGTLATFASGAAFTPITRATAAPNSLFLSLDDLDGSGNSKLVRRGTGANYTVIG